MFSRGVNWNDCTKDCKCTGFIPYRIREETQRKGRKHISYGMLNKHHSEAAKRKISQSKKGRPHSEGTKGKISLGHLAHKKRLALILMS